MLKKVQNNNLLTLITIVLSTIFLLVSFYYLYSKSNIVIALKNTKQYNVSQEMKTIINNNNLNFKDIKKYKINTSIEELYLKDILAQHNIKQQASSYQDCIKLKGKEKDVCFYNFFYHKYLRFLDTKGILDYRLCSDIKEIFGINNDLYKRCIFVYAVNSGTKYLNINECNKIPDNLNIGKYTKERCKNNIIYAVFGKDNVIGKYLMKVKERGDGEKSPMYQQLLNKHADYIKGGIQGIEFYNFNIKDFLDNQYEEYQKEKNN